MNKQGFRGVIILIILIWAGSVLGISFLEAPLKFQAPKVTLAIGLGIGRLVFGALNKIELLYAISLIVFFFITNPGFQIKFFMGVILAILAVQTIWLLPALDARAEIIVQGGIVPSSNTHIVYLVMEAFKLILLMVTGFKMYNEALRIQKLQ